MSLLKRLLSENNNFIASAIRRQRARDIDEAREKFKWDGKIHPSSLTLTMCPVEYFQDINTYRERSLELLEWGDDGTYKHKQIQDYMLRIPGLLMFPEYPTLELAVKSGKIYPEIPVYDEEFKVAGRADAVIKFRGEPCAIDIKTKQSQDKDWQRQFAITSTSVKAEAERTQLKVYAFLMNKYEYFSSPIRKIGLFYINLCLTPRDKNRELEVYLDFTEEDEGQIKTLLTHLARERELFLAGESTVCSYPLCKKHHEN